MNKTTLLSACVAGALLLGACKPTMQSPDTIADRAEKRWQLIIDNKTAQAYDYFTPGYRQVVKREEYEFDVTDRPITWLSIAHRETSCESELRCTVVLELEYKTNIPLRGVTQEIKTKKYQRETWLRADDGRWYFMPKKLGSPNINAEK